MRNYAAANCFFLTATLALAPQAHAQISLDSVRKVALGQQAPAPDPGTDRASSGLKEALSLGVNAAVSSTGRPGGYFDNPAIKIQMPERIETITRALQAVGAGAQIEAFVRSMNSAAEEAAPEAKAILLDALKQMTFSDARGIVTGGNTAGTQFFERTSTEQIQAAFKPIIERTMAKSGVVNQYRTLMKRAPSVPFFQTPPVDIVQYVLDKATEGLFFIMGQEEMKIRTNPAAQVTPLLKSVFGGR